jgi:recombination protein RecA
MKDILKNLKSAGLLSDQEEDFGNVPTGSFALNKIISGSYTKGIPVGAITQFHGESSTAKTVFATHILIEAQKKNYFTVLIDSENAYNATFAEKLGLDPSKLIYKSPETLEDCFQSISDIIIEIREQDSDTPIVIAYDSLAVSPSKAEYEEEGFQGNNMQGAIRAKSMGACLRKINPIIKQKKVALLVINQIRSKVGILFGNPDTMAAGGKSLEYYLCVNLKTLSNKTSDLIKDDSGNVIGIKGTIRNTKNKLSLPFQECEFELIFNEGLSRTYGLVQLLVKDGILEKNSSWYSFNGSKFQEKSLPDIISRKLVDFSKLADIINGTGE